MNTLRSTILLGGVFLAGLSGCGDDKTSDLPPPDQQPGGGGVAGDEAMKKEQEKIKELLNQPKAQPQQ